MRLVLRDEYGSADFQPPISDPNPQSPVPGPRVPIPRTILQAPISRIGPFRAACCALTPRRYPQDLLARVVLRDEYGNAKTLTAAHSVHPNPLKKRHRLFVPIPKPLSVIAFGVTQLKAQGSSRTCNESKEGGGEEASIRRCFIVPRHNSKALHLPATSRGRGVPALCC